MTPINSLKIIQINVRSWSINKNSISNLILTEDADIALINEHGSKSGDTMKIWNYNTYKTNKLNGRNNGCAIAIKKSIVYRIHENYISDMLSLTIDTNNGPIEIATCYIPPRIGYLNYICRDEVTK